MSHALGAQCAQCHEKLTDSRCPECDTLHGWADTMPSAWAASVWPNHPCFAPHADDRGRADVLLLIVVGVMLTLIVGFVTAVPLSGPRW